MRIIAFSDFHGNSIAVDKAKEIVEGEKPDLLLISGDLGVSSRSSAMSVLERLSSADIPIFFVPGNMDTPELASFEYPQTFKCIHGRCERIGDVSFTGVGGAVRGPFMTPFENTEEEIRQILEKGAKECDSTKTVLVSHVPPKNTSIDLTRSGVHVGSTAVRDFIEAFQPILVVCGHVHEARGTDEIGGTIVVNPGPAQNWFYSQIELSDSLNVRLLEFV